MGLAIMVAARRECKQVSVKSDDRKEGEKKKVELELSGRNGGALEVLYTRLC